MSKVETIEEFYKRKFDWMPDNIRNDIGHFNVFKLDPFVGEKAKPVPYKKREYYKIMLSFGDGEIHYADRVVAMQKRALVFSNPAIPYKWEHTDCLSGGVFLHLQPAFFSSIWQFKPIPGISARRGPCF